VIVVRAELEGGEIWVGSEELGVFASGASFGDAVSLFWDRLEQLVVDFVDADPSTLSESGIEFRALLRRHLQG
jgi:hypothetical protein